MKTIKTDTHYLLVDETADIKEGDYCNTNYGIDKVHKVGIRGIRYFNTLSMMLTQRILPFQQR